MSKNPIYEKKLWKYLRSLVDLYLRAESEEMTETEKRRVTTKLYKVLTFGEENRSMATALFELLKPQREVRYLVTDGFKMQKMSDREKRIGLHVLERAAIALKIIAEKSTEVITCVRKEEQSAI